MHAAWTKVYDLDLDINRSLCVQAAAGFRTSPKHVYNLDVYTNCCQNVYTDKSVCVRRPQRAIQTSTRVIALTIRTSWRTKATRRRRRRRPAGQGPRRLAAAAAGAVRQQFKH